MDLFKALQFIPGVKAASELSSGLYVRGGSPDQTLILVDGMIIYNPAHLGNFTSTFNSNALQDIKLIKGAFPAEYGGRLSSVLDIKLRSGTKERDIGSLGVGLINSSITMEGPMTENSTYIISGRGMYYDLFQKSFDNESIIPRYNFYDFNTKFTYTFSESDIVSISGMFSKDNLYNPPQSREINYDINWQNAAININWLQVSSASYLTNTTLSYINYEFRSLLENGNSTVTASDYFASSKLTDFILRKNFELYFHEDHTLKIGAEACLHKYNLIASNFYNPLLELDSDVKTDILSIESSMYFQSESKITSFLKSNIGARFYYLANSKYLSVEPRVSFTLSLTDNLQLKSAYAAANQFLHLVVRNDISLPTDLWYPSTKNIYPGTSQQYVFGIDFNSANREYLLSLEGYYRDMKNLYEFKEDAKFDIGESIEELFTKGEGEAYGIEFFLNKRKGNLSGWIGYTLSWTKRLFPNLNASKIFFPRYDRRHDVSLVLTYSLSPAFDIGATWTYATGQGFTLPIGQYQFNDVGTGNDPDVRLNYTNRNGYKLPDYHKMDLNITYRFNWLNLPFEAYLNIYNIYNRKNSFAQYISVEENPDDPNEKILKLKQITLFPFIPAAGINFKF